jgi:hypothetical protein
MFKPLLAFLLWFALATSAIAQGCGPSNPNCIVPTAPPGTNNNQAASTAFVQTAVGGGGPVSCANLPALTGNVTTPGASCTTTIAPSVVTSSMLASGAAAANIGSLGGALSGTLPSPSIAPGSANTVLGTLNGTTETNLAVPSCSGTNQSLNWTSGTGFGCVTGSGGNAGYLSVYYNGTAWVAQLPNGTFLNTSSTTTCAIQEAINYAWSTTPNQGVVVYGQGSAVPCNISGVTISVPAGQGSSFLCLACVWNFTNTTHNGLVFDTQKELSWKMPGGVINYNGTGVAIEMNPATSVNGNIWSIWSDYDFGFVEGNTSTCGALYYINLGVNGASQPASSNFANNKIHFAGLFGGNVCQYNIRYPTPAGSFNAGGENWFDFNDNQDASVAEINIGSTGGSSLDVNLGTNKYKGGMGHTSTAASGNVLQTDSSFDDFELTEFNCYQSVASQFNVDWGPNAQQNTIRTPQILTCTGGLENGTTQTPALNNYLNGAWRAYTPSLSCASGSLTSATATGAGVIFPAGGGLSKTIHFWAKISITTIGTCASQLEVGLPVTSNSNFFGTMACRETANNGDAMTGTINSSATTMGVQNYINSLSTLSNGSVVACSGTYETQ